MARDEFDSTGSWGIVPSNYHAMLKLRLREFRRREVLHRVRNRTSPQLSTMRRAALDLAQILKARGDVATACGLLAPLCARFTEGHDTADLKDAKALLKELNG